MIRTAAALILVAGGIAVYTLAMFGLVKQRYILNRIHVAALCDTVGLLMVMSGLVVISGFSFVSLKLALILICVWLTNPISTHFLAKAEVMLNFNGAHYEVQNRSGEDI